MFFNSWEFAGFFAVVYALYLVLPFRPQSIMLLGASWVFYGCWDWRFLFLLLFSTVVDYWVGRSIENAEGQSRRRLVLVSILVNLTFLGIFKYYNFFASSAVDLLGMIGVKANLPFLKVILPVGISFYTFQAMAYTIDVYRGQARACRDFITFALYVAYFPHLVAGPIQRTDDLLPQLLVPRRITYENIASGAVLVLIGLVRKVAIADLAAPWVDRAFNQPELQSSGVLLFGVVMFAVQIYGDFAGYTDIARGVSRMMGIELIENFRRPYFSSSVQEFWTRWHISLSRWLRCYLYIPLGGNRGPTWFVCRNLMLTMLLGGLWHGASWTFVIWGLIHGLALIVHRTWSNGRGRPETPEPALRRWAKWFLSWALTMLVVGVAWVFFRAASFQTACQLLVGIVRWHGGWPPVMDLLLAAYAVALLLLIDIPQAVTGEQEAVRRWPWYWQGCFYAVLMLSLAILRSMVSAPFIYFQF